jgi:heterodisulfide reductase subunit A2
MAHVLVVGGGLSGCTAALELANRNTDVTIIEKAESIGGKVRQYGCKSTENCNNCGLCLAGGLWESVENNSRIKVITMARVVDVTGSKGNFTVTLKGKESYKTLTGISSIIVSIGFESPVSQSSGSLEFAGANNIISGSQIEEIIKNRSRQGLMPEAPSKIAFIQCFGSRDIQEKALYCSRVCCGYSTRAAKVMKYYYPDAQVVFFYMDLQYVEEGRYFDVLTREGLEFIRCRPVKIKSGKKAKILYEQRETGKVIEREFDLIVLSEGIHPPADAEHIAELCTLGIDERGFLKPVGEGAKTGIYVAGCASGPKRIEETYAESLKVARQLLADIG